MRVRFWGVRGSVPWATQNSIGYGCNTPCVEIRDKRSGAELVLDAGSGIVGLGEEFENRTRQIPILLTHFHWDHLQGLPFFSQLYQEGWEPTVWAPTLRNVDKAWVDQIFQQPFFPVPIEALPSRPAVSLVAPGESVVGDFKVRAIPLTHPGGAFAYRITGTNGDVVYATDHEFGNPAVDEPLAEFCKGAAELILDAHFTPEELPFRKGWGHGSWLQCAEFAKRVGAGRLWLFHHKPGRSDDELKEIEARACEVFARTKAASECDGIEV